MTVKQQVAPLQASEVAIIRRKCGQFDVSVKVSFLLVLQHNAFEVVLIYFVF